MTAHHELCGIGRVYVLLFALVVLSAAPCRGESAAWLEPDIDTWVYPNAFVGSGSRVFAPSFGSGVSLNEETNTLNPGVATRLGFTSFAFETTNEVTPSLDPERYLVHSVTVTAKSERGQGGLLTYEPDPVTPATALADVLAGTYGAQLPMELYGVGFDNGFEGFALGVDQSGDRFSESDEGWSGGEKNLFPLDAEGRRDATNNINGGFSATELGGETDPFVAKPLAIGVVPGVVDGDALPDDTVFEFDLDLAHAGVMDYVQQGLADGVLGFALSSLHTGSFGSQVGSPYPQWYTKEAVGLFQNAAPATLSIDFEILPLPGDYDGNGFVEAADYDTWVSDFGTSVVTPGTGADGNQDGLVDVADYTVWRDNLVSATIAIPEPTTGSYVVALLLTTAFCVGLGLSPSPRGPRK